MLDLRDRTVLLTGGTGSFGQGFTRYLAAFAARPRRLVIFSRDEQKQFEMISACKGLPLAIEYRIGDVKDYPSLEAACRGVDIVVHAAAMKHVPMAESNPIECFKTNILGSQNVILAAERAGVQRVVALSTDKAVHPIGAYGASKLALEVLFLDADRRSPEGGCRYSVVRYGNIFGTKGSVVPFFLKARQNGFLPLTAPEATRFSLSLQDSIDLVVYALEHGWGGEVVLPKAPSYRLLDLANAIDPEIEKRTVGLRPAEKLHELLYSKGEAGRVLDGGGALIVAPEAGRWQAQELALSRSLERPGTPDGDYCSSQNTHWLTEHQLRDQVSELT